MLPYFKFLNESAQRYCLIPSLSLFNFILLDHLLVNLLKDFKEHPTHHVMFL